MRVMVHSASSFQMSCESWLLQSWDREKASGTVGRSPRPFRVIFDGIAHVLRTGCPWHVLPRQVYVPGSTVHARFSQWVKAGGFYQAWQIVLAYYDQAVGIDWKWQALDGAITKRVSLKNLAVSSFVIARTLYSRSLDANPFTKAEIIQNLLQLRLHGLCKL